MARRRLGLTGPTVFPVGLGCLGMSEHYGRADRAEAIATIHRAVDLGVDFLDTADMYGAGENERLVGEAIRGRREAVFVATKFGNVIGPNGERLGVCGRPEHVRASCEASLRRLGVEAIDLYTQHRVDPATPIEETVGAMADLVAEGKVRFLGLSEASAATVRRAHAVHPIAALQSEYSLFTRDPEEDVLPTLRELGIALVAYSPLGRGFLAGRFGAPDEIPEGDSRRARPRFLPENFARNAALLSRLKEIAAAKGVTPGQLALAWVLSTGDDVIPIPGTKRRAYLEENVAAAGVTLSPQERAELDAAFPPGAAAGARYSPDQLAKVGL